MSARDDAASADATPSSLGGIPPAAAPPTYAAFSPVTLTSNTPSRTTRRSTILVHQKSPLLLATPPQVTRALAYSHPFVLVLNHLAGLLTWTSGDLWQSFLLLCAFWAVVLYGDVIVRRGGPIVLGLVLIAGMYARRYSPLSSSGWSEPARQAKQSAASDASNSGAAPSPARPKDAGGNAADAKAKAGSNTTYSQVTGTKHQKTLDEIVETLKEFTGRCNVLMEPLLELTDFLSTQRTATSATTKPALTAMFARLLIVTPFWLALTMPPWRVITTRRVMLVAGTLLLTWHARVMRVSRTILWRSATVRRLAAAITGLRFDRPAKGAAPGTAGASPSDSAAAASSVAPKLGGASGKHGAKSTGSRSSGVKFTFIIYENQRRWIGLGWMASLFAYERPAWTDEHNNQAPTKDDFELPDVEDGSQMRWQWAEGSRWRVDGVADDHEPVDYDGDAGRNGWVYYDNKWQNGRRGQDGWGKWTRRRKWYRDAELVEVDASAADMTHGTASGYSGGPHMQRYSTAGEKMVSPMGAETTVAGNDQTTADDASTKTTDDTASTHSTSSKSSFWPASLRKRATDRPRNSSDKDRPSRRPSEAQTDHAGEDDASGLGVEIAMELQKQGKDGGQWGIGDEARMNLE